MVRWFKNRRQALLRDIAAEVIRQLEGQRGWKKFLPPVALRDCIYLTTEDGEIYRMNYDAMSGMEMVCKIRTM